MKPNELLYSEKKLIIENLSFLENHIKSKFPFNMTINLKIKITFYMNLQARD